MPSPQTTKPVIALLSLNWSGFFDEMYQGFLNSLTERATVKRFKRAKSIIDYLDEHQPLALLLTDAGITKRPDAYNRVCRFIREGGTVVCSCTFSSFIRPLNMDNFFKDLGLDWRFGPYYRTDACLNLDTVNAATDGQGDKADSEYSQKAVWLTGVPADHAWYTETSENLAGVCMARVGEGKFGYTGDVNAEDGTCKIVLAMCGLKI